MPAFTKEELIRYNRQIMLPEIGIGGQEKIKNSKILVVGAGGLGCPVLQYLCAAGIGTIGIVDFDKIELHNLHRQILFSAGDIGKSKAETAAEKLKVQNPNVSLLVFNEMLNEQNAGKIISQFEIVVDGSDNFLTRYLVNDTCVKFKKSLVYGSILKSEAQVAVFNHKGGKNLRDIFPEPPNPEDVPNCDENGVIGTVPGIVGVYLANATIQLILDQYENDSMIIIDFSNWNFSKLKI